ncbi:bifunctional nicotinamidase/pyrazinamidase [Azospirillum sp. ST 5-10]|uniref:bifunctional nicotinamidase/pyrazinamidase n=1 Tax=unclassified Azospirillum TaxID=2630922 RepID=UPI003F4A56DB
MASFVPRRTDALIVVDVQNDFCPGGALAVPDGDAVVAVCNRLARRFAATVLTQDWHPPGHASFASSHPGKAPFDTAEMPYGTQVLWPDHCVQGTRGAEFHPDLDVPGANLIVRKGFHPGIDSYSTFYENDRTTPTGLAGYLRERGVTRVFLVGLATDFCVAFSAEDAVRHGFAAVVVEDGCRAIDLPDADGGTLAAARRRMAAAGVEVIRSERIATPA